MFYYVIIVSFWILYTKHTGVLALKTVLKVFKAENVLLVISTL